MINEFDSPQSEMSSMANANAYGDKTAQTNKDPQTSNNDAPPNNPFTTWQHVPTKNGDKLSVYQAGDYYFSIQANNGEYKYSYVSKKNLPPNILPDDLFNYAKVKAGSWKPLADPQKLGAPARYDVSKTKDPLKSLRPTLGYSWNGGNTSTTPQLNNGDKSAKLPSTNIPIDRSISPDVESSWLTQLSNAASVVLDIGVELIDLSPLGDLSRIIIGTDVRGNPVTLEERLITMGCLLIPGSKYAVKAVDAAVTIAKKGGDVAKTMVKKGSATVKKLANDVDKFVDEMGAYTKSPSPFPPLMPEFASGADFDQWAKKQFSQEATNTKAAKSTTQHNFKKPETSSSTSTTKKTELTTKEDIKGNSEMGEPQKSTLNTTNTSSKKTETSTPTTNTSVPTTKKTEPRTKEDIRGDLDKIRKELNDNGGKLSGETEAKINKLLDELNSHTNLAAQQAANLQERLRGLLNIVGLSLKTTMRIERLLEQLQGINAPATPQEQTTSPQLPATPLEANFKDLTLDERIKELQQRKKDGTITHVEEQELGNLEFAAQQNNADELRKRIEEIEKDASIEPAEKERVLKLLREKLAGGEKAVIREKLNNGMENSYNGSEEEKLAAKAKISDWRRKKELEEIEYAKSSGQKANPNKWRGGNYGYLEGEVDGVPVDNKMYRSGGLKPAIEIFTAIEVENKNTKQIHKRDTDSEYKMLTELANKLGAKKGNVYPQVFGELKIVSENPYCESCEGVVKQFNKMFPNIKLILINGAK